MAHKIRQLVEYHPLFSSESEPRIEYGPRQLFKIVLEQVNLVRTALAIGEGKLPKLPPGVPGDAQHCVIAAALSNGWKPCVADDEIMLEHPTKGIDWDAIKATLEAYGFQDVELGITGRPSRPKKTRTITFRTPAAMAQLIFEFDKGELPSLLTPQGRKIVAENNSRQEWF